MYRGRLCEVGAGSDVFALPSHPYTRALLSAIPIADPSAARQGARIRLADPDGSAGGGPGCVFRDRCPVTIGPICDMVAPTARASGPGHTIVCHHELGVLLEPSSQLAERPEQVINTGPVGRP